MNNLIKIFLLVFCVFFLITCSSQPVKTWVADDELKDITILDPIHNPADDQYLYAKQLQNTIYQIVEEQSDKSKIQLLKSDWLLKHQNIFKIWQVLDGIKNRHQLIGDDESLFEKLAPYDLFKTNRILLLRLYSFQKDRQLLKLEGYRLIQTTEGVVDHNYYQVILPEKKLSQIKPVIKHLLFSMKYASPDFSSLGFENVPAGCYRNLNGEEHCLETFFLSRYPITDAQWQHISPMVGVHYNNKYPKTNVSWHEIQYFIDKLNQNFKGKFRLPTIHEWQYACIKSNTTNGNFIGKKGKDKWHGVSPVDAFEMKNLNIADLTGNTWEWTTSAYEDPNSNAILRWLSDITGESDKIIAGGSFDTSPIANNCYLDTKLHPDISLPDTGFRLVWEP